MVYMVLWEQVLTPIYAINEWEADASLEKHKRKNKEKHKVTKGCVKLNKLRKKLIVWAAGSAERDLYHETHCKLRSSAAVGTCDTSTHIVPRRGTDASRMMLRMIVGPALRNQERVRWCLSHSCAPSELAVGFWWIRVPSGHGVLLWEAAWLRRDAIASYVSPVRL
jgi:hypothetical protein